MSAAIASGIRDALLSDVGVEHAFGTRSCPAPERVARVQQVHGHHSVVARGAADASLLGEADAVATECAGLAVAVVTADCVPILASTRDGDAVVAIHAGWRGLAAGVVASGVAALRALRPGVSIVAAIGPHIGMCCYEVDAPVTDALAARCDADALRQAMLEHGAGHHMLDLGLLVASELARLGLARGEISQTAAACTHCDARRFHSYRRDGGAAGRLVHHVRAAC